MAGTFTGWRAQVFGPAAHRYAVLLAALLTLPFCWAGIFADDYYHQLALEQPAAREDGGGLQMPATRWDLYTFAHGDAARTRPVIEHGPYAWWTLPELKFSFLRPSSVALTNLDDLVFGRAFFWHHLHSLAWYLALVAVVAALLRRALGLASPLAALAALLFAVDDSHAVVAGWIANRNALVATVPALLGVLAHLWWRERGDWRGLPLSLLACAVGLAGGESAVAALAYLGAYELTAAPGPWRTRALKLVPVGLLGVGYLVLYKLSGFGAYGSEIYVDPLREPLRFLLLAPPKALALVGALFLGSSADLWLLVLAARPVLVAMGVLALVIVGLLARAVWPLVGEEERRGLRWLSLGAALSLVPVLATFPLNRLLLMPSIGGSALVAAIAWHGWRAPQRLVRWGARLLVFVAVVGVLGWPGAAVILRSGAAEQTRTALQTPLSDEALARRVVVFVAPDPAAALYVPIVRAWHHKPRGQTFLTLSFAPFAHRLHRTAPDTVELTVVDGRMLETVFEQLMRSAAFPVPQGQRVRLDGLEVTVLELDRGLPRRIAVRFDQDPDEGGYTLAQWTDGQLVPLVLPAVGQTLEVPRLRSFFSP